MSKQENNSADDIVSAVKGFSLLALFIAGAVPVGLGWYFWENPNAVREMSKKHRLLVVLALALLVATSWYLWLCPVPFFKPDRLYIQILGPIQVRHLCLLPWFWIAGSSVVILMAPIFLLFKKPDEVLKLSHFKKVACPKKELQTSFQNQDSVPIGINVQTGKIETLDQKRRCSHVLILGATGSGKSTLMFNMVLHAVRHKQPVLIIDPKGEMASLNRFVELARSVDSDFDQRFKLFSMGSPEISASYNPLKNGSAIEKKDRILEALNWSEQFYQSMSGSYLTSVLSAIELTQTPLTLDYLEKLSSRKEIQRELKKKLMDLGMQGDKKAENLFQTLEVLFDKRGEELLGLQAQISILNNPSFGHLLSFDQADNEIDLREALQKNQIVYFQLNTLGNADTARRLGRMIIEDAKALAHHVYNTVPNESDRKFFPIFIDEFGSFAAKEFIEFLKQSRGAKFGIHLFCQGLEDLDAVSPEFRRQSTSNPMTTICLRVTDNETVNEVAAIAGTVDSVEQSYQVEGEIMQSKTGLGNMRMTKQMRIEHDVLRNLNNLQAVIIMKSKSYVGGIHIYFTNHLL